MRGNPSTSRALNRRLILNLLRNRGAMPRAEIATVTGLSPAAVTFVVTELVEEGLVIEEKRRRVPRVGGLCRSILIMMAIWLSASSFATTASIVS